MSDGPYDYARERHEAERADSWRFPPPGQWIAGEWREPEVSDVSE
jgi:hypothetical protein